MTSNYWQNKVAIVTGASSGLGLHLSQTLAQRGAKVVMAARTQSALETAAATLSAGTPSAGTLSSGANRPLPIVTDITHDESVDNLLAVTLRTCERVDAVFNCAGRSMRRAVLETTPDDFRELIETNFLGVVRVTRACVPQLLQTHGHLVNIGSLSGKVGTRFYGAYPASKFCLSAYSQQLRLELAPAGLHVLLVNPGPIRRDDSGRRYDTDVAGVPAEALRPGGGAKTSALDPVRLCELILAACERRDVELTLPAKARWLFAIGQLWPRLGDRLLLKFT